MMTTIVWCAMMMGGVPVHAEGIILARGNEYYSIRFDDGIQAVRRTSCLFIKPEGSSYLPLTKRN